MNALAPGGRYDEAAARTAVRVAGVSSAWGERRHPWHAGLYEQLFPVDAVGLLCDRSSGLVRLRDQCGTGSRMDWSGFRNRADRAAPVAGG